MNEEQAKALAGITGGDPWQSGGGIWLAVKRTTDGRVISMSGEIVIEYEDEEAFQDDRRQKEIVLA